MHSRPDHILLEVAIVVRGVHRGPTEWLLLARSVSAATSCLRLDLRLLLIGCKNSILADHVLAGNFSDKLSIAHI
jgi:hypothetical protein